jgi:hypothetical protein
MSRIDNGHQTTVAFANIASPLFWEKTVKPPGMSGGGANDTTTMRNVEYRTQAPKTLKTLTPMTMQCAYDPAFLDDVVAQTQVNQLITITFPDNATWQFWGWIEEMEPGEIAEGGQPTLNITVQPSNQNDSGVETAPVYTA